MREKEAANKSFSRAREGTEEGLYFPPNIKMIKKISSYTFESDEETCPIGINVNRITLSLIHKGYIRSRRRKHFID